MCSAGLCASGVLYVKSRAPESARARAAAPPLSQRRPLYCPRLSRRRPLPRKSINGSRLSRFIPMPCFRRCSYPPTRRTWFGPSSGRRNRPTLQGDAAIRAVVSQPPWDPSVKSLVAFPQLMALMGEEIAMGAKHGRCVLGQPQDVMDAVQRLRLLAQQTGSLKSTPQQTVTSVPKSSASTAVTTTTTTTTSRQYASNTVDRHQKLNPQIRRWCTCQTITPRRCGAG